MQRLFLLLFFLILLPGTTHAMDILEARDAGQLLRLFDAHVAKRITTFAVRTPPGFNMPLRDILNACCVPAAVSKTMLSSSGWKVTKYKFLLYPGTRVADAYITNNVQHLSDEELRLYRRAEDILWQARNMTPLQAELYFHDIVCRSCEYEESGPAVMGLVLPRRSTAIGALLDGRANCQGYSDAFAMLCRMRGLPALIRGGVAKGRPHAWNLVHIHGGWHAVDVTWDDLEVKRQGFISHVYFNIPSFLLRETHSWITWDGRRPNESLDDAYYYGRLGHPFGTYARDIDEAAKFIAASILRGASDIRVMVHVGSIDPERVLEMAKAEVGRARRALRWVTAVQTLGDYAFFTSTRQ